MRDWLYAFGRDGCVYFGLNWCQADWWQTGLWPIVWVLLGIGCVVLPLLGAVAFMTLWERRLIAFMQVRLGPNRLGPLGLLQPVADIVKLLLKEVIRPDRSDKFLYYLGPIMTIMPAMAAWAVVPFGPDLVLANVNAGLLYLFAITSMEVYGVIMAGWASNSKYPLLGAMRASAQMLSYEIAMGICILVVLMVTGSLHIGAIVQGQTQGWFASHGLNFLSWNWLPLLLVLAVAMRDDPMAVLSSLLFAALCAGSLHMLTLLPNDGRPALAMHARGLEHAWLGQVPWSQVRAVSLAQPEAKGKVQPVFMLALDVTSPRELEKRLPWIVRRFARAPRDRAAVMGPVWLPLNGLDCEPRLALAAAQKFLAASRHATPEDLAASTLPALSDDPGRPLTTRERWAAAWVVLASLASAWQLARAWLYGLG